jgi:hypothetical protein
VVVDSAATGMHAVTSRATRHRRRLVVCLVLLGLVALPACGAGMAAEPHPPHADAGEEPGAVRPPPSLARPAALRGDPNFAVSGLADQWRVEYERLLREIGDRDNVASVLRLAASDDIYTYGRILHAYVQPILTVFRVTGDLALLDHVDVIAERMRRELRDGWRGTNDRTDGTRDGYLNWSYRFRDSPEHQGKDTRFLDDIKTHGLIVMIAYALHLNRDLESPSGRDYAAHADFWRDYLVHHFEAKWRERRRVPTGFPIMEHPDGHSYYTWTKWHFYMGLLTGDAGYTAEAHRMADVIWKEIRTVDVAGGPAYVWASNITSLSKDRNYLMSSSYANSVFGDVVTFHLEGFHRWASADRVRAYARTVTTFVLDDDDPLRNGIAADIGGGRPRAGLPAEPVSPRRTSSAFTTYQYAVLAPWDETGRIARISRAVHDGHPTTDTTRLTAGLFLNAHLRGVVRSAEPTSPVP